MQEAIHPRLARFVFRLVSELETSWTEEEKREAAELIADQTWHALIYELRRVLTNHTRVVIPELGAIDRSNEESWAFLPAASLASAASRSEDARDVPSDAQLARVIENHLKEALAIADLIPRDCPAHPDAGPQETLAAVLWRMGQLTMRAAERLEPMHAPLNIIRPPKGKMAKKKTAKLAKQRRRGSGD